MAEIPMKKTVTYIPMWETAEGRIGTGMGYDLRIDALDELAHRDANVVRKDKRQWLKVLTTDYEEIKE